MTPSLDELNRAPLPQALALLDGLYEHSPWVAERALAQRPFATLAALHQAMVQAVRQATPEEQLALIQAHPELAGKAMVAGTLTAASADEQTRAGLTHCTPEEFERLHALNAAYRARLGHPFILAVRGPDGRGLTRHDILAALQRRLDQPADEERAECLRQIHRIAELRLSERFGQPPRLGLRVWDALQALAQHSESPWAQAGQLTVTYLSAAHQACAHTLQTWMQQAGCDEVAIDAVGNVVGRYHGVRADAPRLLLGSHYDTVRNAGRYDGRLGIVLAIEVVRELRTQGQRLPFALELVAFAEEEGQRFPVTFLGSSALAGTFDPAWLDVRDANGVTLRAAMQQAGLPGTMPAIAALRRDPGQYLGYLEVHIEQGPVLARAELPLGVVSAINASLRAHGCFEGLACHAGTTPMTARRDALLGLAELALAVERYARQQPGAVGTVGVAQVDGGSINVVPGRCTFTLDLRAPSDPQCDELARQVWAEAEAIAQRRGLRLQLQPTLRAAAAPGDAALRARWRRALQRLGLPVLELPSGAGHDAMMLHRILPQAMLFVRGEHLGISHHPLESSTAHDIDLAAQALLQLLRDWAEELA